MTQRLLFALILAALLISLAAWFESFQRPLKFYLTLHDRYGLACDHGTWQFSVTNYSKLLGFKSTGFRQSPIILTDARQLPSFGLPQLHLRFGLWRPWQTALCYTTTTTPYVAVPGPPPVIKTAVDGAWLHIYALACWLPTTILAAAAALLLWRLHRAIAARRRDPGCCPTCGYDLRATPHRCPECGSIPTPEPSPHSQSLKCL